MTKKVLENSEYGTQVKWNGTELLKNGHTATIPMMAIKVVGPSLMDQRDLSNVVEEIVTASATPVKIISSERVRAGLISLFLDRVGQRGEQWHLRLMQYEIELCVDDRCDDNAYIVYKERGEVRAGVFANLEELP